MDPISSASSGGYVPPTSPLSVNAGSANAPVSDSTAASTTSPQNDSVTISPQGTKAAQYAQQARVLAPLDADQVKKLKEAIAQGKYPPPALVQGLVNLVGNNIASS